MTATRIPNTNQVMVRDRFDKWVTFEITPNSARLVEKAGSNWTPQRLKMAWNKAKDLRKAD